MQAAVAFADDIILNKSDLVSVDDLDELETRIRSMNAMARIHRAHDARVPIETVLDVGGFDLHRALEQKPTFLEPEYPFRMGGPLRVRAHAERRAGSEHVGPIAPSGLDAGGLERACRSSDAAAFSGEDRARDGAVR
ncbi:GTP-binding protein [Pendulispora rubella]|uniref:GTP-binding protein n=1 Tax=Pendulispora rubella TaxID=2741070 RepID=UPI00374E01EC